MRSIEQLIEDSKDERLRKLPKWVEQLVYELALRLLAADRAADRAEKTALQEVTAARALLAGGPQDSDTFMDLPRAIYDENDGEDQRALGKGTTIEFRDADSLSGEGTTVKRLPDGTLVVNGFSQLAVIPVNPHMIHIEVK